MTARPKPRVLDGTITNPDQVRHRMVTLARKLKAIPLDVVFPDGEQLCDLVLWMDVYLGAGWPLPTAWAEDGTVNHARPVTNVRAQPSSGQATYEAFNWAFSDGHDEPWASLDADERGRWAAVAAAQPAPVRAAAHLVTGHRDVLINALAIAWGASLPGSATIAACPACGCPDPQCGDSTWDHECQAERLCDTHTAARAAAANFAHLEQALRAINAGITAAVEVGGNYCPCEADGPDGLCACCRSGGEHNGSCAAPAMPPEDVP